MEKKEPQSLEASFTVKSKSDISGQSFIEILSKRLKGRTVLMVEMAKIFLNQAPVMRAILANQRENHEAIRFEAHKFKSTVNIIGLSRLKEIAAKTEELYHHGKPEEDTEDLLNDFVAQIDIDYRKVELAIEKMMQMG